MKPRPDTKPENYYVTIHDGTRFGFLAGPFRDDHAVRSSPHFRGGVNRPASIVHWAALDLVDRCREITEGLDTWAHFYAFGTARIDYDYDKPGKLNARLGLAPARSARLRERSERRGNSNDRPTHEGRRESARLYHASKESAETTHTEKGGAP
jgi:hypothetical protein